MRLKYPILSPKSNEEILYQFHTEFQPYNTNQGLRYKDSAELADEVMNTGMSRNKLKSLTEMEFLDGDRGKSLSFDCDKPNGVTSKNQHYSFSRNPDDIERSINFDGLGQSGPIPDF